MRAVGALSAGAAGQQVSSDEHHEKDAGGDDGGGDGREFENGEGAQAGCRSASVARMLGGVEMPVNGPPSRQPKASGISSRPGGRPLRRASSMVPAAGWRPR
jgi:hypothetical protein